MSIGTYGSGIKKEGRGINIMNKNKATIKNGLITKDTLIFSSQDGFEISAKSWLPKKKPKAIVQVVHGMSEHIERYHDFALELVKNGFGVYGNDHRSHGESIKSMDDICYFGEDEGVEKAVDDLHTLTKIIKDKHPGVPVFLYGHSFGSSLSRRYITKYNNEELQGLLLSGISGNQGLLGQLGFGLSRVLTKIQGPKTKSPLFDTMMFGEFNKAFKPGRTNFDWLTSDEEHVDKYINDPLCGNIYSISSYRDIIGTVLSINNPKSFKEIPKDLPISIFTGALDPVTSMAKGSQEVEANLKKAGVKNVTHKIYENCRHELINETNREDIYKDFVDWLDVHC